MNSELLPIRHHVENLHLEGKPNQANPARSAGENESIGLSIVRDFTGIDGSSSQLVDDSQLQGLDLLGSLVNFLNQVFQTGRFGRQGLLTGRNAMRLLDSEPAAS